MSQVYGIRYDFGRFEKHQAADEQGLCDAFLLVSIVRTGEGTSYLVLSADGESESELTSLEKFKVFSVLAAELKDSLSLAASHRLIARNTFLSVQKNLGYAKCLHSMGSLKT